MKNYLCPKCGMEYDAPGKCEMCDVELEEVKDGVKKGHKEGPDHSGHHEMMVRDFKKRFFVSIILTIPVLILSPLIQQFFKFKFGFAGDKYALFVIAAIIFFYGGLPFLKGLFTELKKRQPGMMTLIALAITVAFVYSSAVVFGLEGKFFFWEELCQIHALISLLPFVHPFS